MMKEEAVVEWFNEIGIAIGDVMEIVVDAIRETLVAIMDFFSELF